MTHMCTLSLIAILAAAAYAAVTPTDPPSMAVKVEAGDYIVRGKRVHVSETTLLPIAPPDMVRVNAEAHVLSDQRPVAWHMGTALKKTLGPVDVGTRLPFAIAPETVEIRSEPSGGTVYEEGRDYYLDHDWGGVSRLEGGTIPQGGKVYVDYAVYLQRIDSIQVSPLGTPFVKSGKPGPVNVEPPPAEKGCVVLANVYIPYRTNAITADRIYPMPEKDIGWQDFVRVSGREHLQRTLGLLKSGKAVTIVCWGDSVTAGGSPSSHDKCYVELFRTRLKAAYPQAQINLINAGIGGSNTESRKAGYEAEVLAHNPDLITVEFVNDAGMSAEHIKKNWDEFIARARAKNPGVEFILITPHNVIPSWMDNFKVSIPAMRRAAADNGVALADTNYIWQHLRDVGIPYETLNANGINHPNDLGHEFFAACLMALMSPDD